MLERREFLKFSSKLALGMALGLKPMDGIPISSIAPSNLKSQKTFEVVSKLGLNIGPHETYSPSKLSSTYAGWVRMPLRPNIDQQPYIDLIGARGLKVMLVIDRISLGPMGFEEGALFYSKKFPSVELLQVGNEPDDEGGRASWIMGRDEFSALLKYFRQSFPKAYLISGGLSSGHPEYLEGIDLDVVDALGLHLYGKAAPGVYNSYGHSEDIGQTIERLGNFRKPFVLSEWGVQHDDFKDLPIVNDLPRDVYLNKLVFETLSFVKRLNQVLAIGYFCYSDKEVPGHGLIHADGNKKPTYFSFVYAAQP